MNNMSEMNLFERYLNAVAERLPEKTREDVKRELRANIEDMLPESPTQEDIREVLEKLGDPARLADEYRQTKRYLIGPNLYDRYISILKLVVGIAVIVFSFIGVLQQIVNPAESIATAPVDFITGFITSILGAAIDGAIQAFMWVTIVFACLERGGLGEGKLSFGKKNWTADDLLSSDDAAKSKISRGETVVGLVFSIIFAAILIFQPQLFGWYEKGESGIVNVTSFFNIDRLQAYIIAIIVLTALQFILSIYMFIVMRWNLPLAIANTLHNIASCLLVFFMLKDHAIVNPQIISRFADAINRPLADVTMSLSNFLSAMVVLFIIFYAIDSIMGFVKSRSIKLPPMKSEQ
jgi:hypothetical protein